MSAPTPAISLMDLPRLLKDQNKYTHFTPPPDMCNAGPVPVEHNRLGESFILIFIVIYESFCHLYFFITSQTRHRVALSDGKELQ